MKLIDIGANLASEQFVHDLPQVIESASQKFVNTIVLTTVDSSSLKKNLIFCQQDDLQKKCKLHTTWGLHPHYAKNLNSFIQISPKDILKNKHVCAIGEFGLDYFRELSSREQQKKSMEYFLQHASQCQLPLFMHERMAFFDFCDIFDNFNLPNKGVVHCFTGTTKEMKAYLDRGLYIGITGWITDNRRNQSLVEAVRYLPLNKIMIETDSPYLKPRTVKSTNHRNEPSYLEHVLKSICQIKSCSFEKLSETIYNNTCDFFNFPK